MRTLAVADIGGAENADALDTETRSKHGIHTPSKLTW